MKQQLMKRGLSLLLAFCLMMGLAPHITFGVNAASNLVNGFQGQDADVFSALGFDTTVLPEGYDPDTTENPYGRDTILGNQVFEALITTNAGNSIFGMNDNSVTSASINTLPDSNNGALKMEMFASAAGDFDGDGLPGEVIFVGYDDVKYNNVDAKANLQLQIYDSADNTYGTKKNIASADPAQVITSGGTKYSRYDYAWQNLLQVTAGDYDCDGIAEIAVYVPEDGNSRVDIYKYQKTSQSKPQDYLDMANWDRVWTHIVSNTKNYIPNMISLASGDFNRDGVDDLAIASGRMSPYGTNLDSVQVDPTNAVILRGGKSNMLQTLDKLDLNEADLGKMTRVSLITGDLDGDGYRELIATGQPIDDLKSGSYTGVLANEYDAITGLGKLGNTTRGIVTYIYDGEDGLAINYSGLHKPMDGEMTQDGNITAWQSGNGFDQYYYSQPLMRTNAAAFYPEGADYPYLYLDSCLYEFVEGQPQLSVSLDDSSYDGENTLGGDGHWGAKYTGGNADYVEFGAVAEDINGDGYDTLITGYYRYDSRNDGSGKHFTGINTLYGSEDGLLHTQKAGNAVSGNTNSYGTMTPVSATMVDADMDTILIEYTGEHYLKYSDPKVLAVIAAAPYYEDVEVVSGYDYAWQNTTSYSESESHTDTKLITVDLEAGAFGIFEKTTVGAKFALETSINYTIEYEEQESDTTEYTLQFETSGDEDAVAFFSIPTENYIYKFSVPNGEGGYDVHYDTISNTFSPSYQVLTLSYYESIQESYEELPPIAGEVLKSTPGDPASYPSSTSGYDVLAYWGADQGKNVHGDQKGSNDPASVSFGNGAITQEISISEEESKAYNMGAALDFKIGGGIGTQSDVTQSETSKVGGFQFSLNPAGGWADVDVSGLTYSGTVTNMPLQFRDYGYYYTWELFVYSFTIDGNNKIPVVSYVVTDVSAPPELPDDFQQDYDRSSSSMNVLTWTYSGPFSKFYIYRYFDFPVGGGLQIVKEIPSSTAEYILKYDENGKPYKEYYFEDTNLAPYTEYEYAIQVERLSKVPPLSTPSALLTARTKAARGYPNMNILESDGKNDAALLVYPDKISYLTVDVTGPEGQAPEECYTTVQYQWQKLESGAWNDLVNETNKTLSLVAAAPESAGEYRCRINVLTNTDATAITAYTDSVILRHSKRTAYVEEVFVNDVSGGGVELYAKIANGHSDSATIPGGMVTFNLTNNQTGITYQRYVRLNAAGIASEFLEDTLPEGMYTIEARYSGTMVFKSCNARTLYLSQRGNGYDLDVPKSAVYGEGLSATFRAVSKAGGVTVAVEAASVTRQLLRGDPLYRNRSNNAKTISGLTNVTLTAGQSYQFTSGGVTYGFDATWSYTGDLKIVDNYIIYGDAVTGSYLHDPNETGLYEIAENTPAGGYVLIMAGADQVDVYAGFTIERRELTLQLPHQKGEEGTASTSADNEPTDAPSVPVGSLAVLSGNWAECDLDSNGNLKSSIGNTGLWLNYLNTAGTVFSRWAVDALCGYYTIVAQEANATRAALANYDITYIVGSYTVLGATREVHVGVRPFESQQVGTIYSISPEYGSSRVDLSSGEKLVQEHATGTRLVFSVVPDEGYEVYDWYINGVAQDSKATSFAHVLLAEDTTVEVQFAIKQNTLIFGTAGDEGGGVILCSDEELTSESAVLANSHFFFTAKANPGYHFKEWRYTEIGNGTAYDETDSGKMESSFELLMPAISCSVYAVFERDFYTFTYSDRSGQNGLTAWYEGAATTDSTAAAQRIYIASGERVKGDTVITVAPRDGYSLHPDYAYSAIGAQGMADYEGTGAYTLKLTEDTQVTGTAQQEYYDLTLHFDVTTTKVFPQGTELVYTIDGEQNSFVYSEEAPELVLEDLPGGTSVSMQIVYPGYYDLLGFTSDETQVTATETPNKTAVEVEENAAVTAGTAYYYEDYSAQGEARTWYFTAPVDGTVIWTENEVTIYTAGTTYTIPALAGNKTVSLHMKEKPVYQVSMADITGKGTYGIELPDGALETADADGNTVISLHRDDILTVLVTPEEKWTVSYWKTQAEGMAEPIMVRATSLKYAIPDISEDFTFTPIFSSTTYNTISWPTIDKDKNGLTLSPSSGYLSSVSAGSDFVFTLSGETEFLVDQVYANGEPFVAGGNGNLTYTGTGEDRVFTIKNIQKNQVITVSMRGIGVTVEGVDINTMSGPGWSYDPNAQVLTLTRSSLLLSGNSSSQAPELTVKLSEEVTTLEIQSLTLHEASDPQDDRVAISAAAKSVSITVNSENSIHGQISADELVLRGNGKLTARNVNQPAISANTLTLLGRVDVTARQGSNSYAVKVDDLYIGTEDSTSANPTLRSENGIQATNLWMYWGLLNATHNGTPLDVGSILYYDGQIELWPGTNTSTLVSGNTEWLVYSEGGYVVQYLDASVAPDDPATIHTVAYGEYNTLGGDKIHQRTDFGKWNQSQYLSVKPMGDSANESLTITAKYTTSEGTVYNVTTSINSEDTWYYGVRWADGSYASSSSAVAQYGRELYLVKSASGVVTLYPFQFSGNEEQVLTDGTAEYTIRGYAENITIDATHLQMDRLTLDGVTLVESQIKVNSDAPLNIAGDNSVINMKIDYPLSLSPLVVEAPASGNWSSFVLKSETGDGTLLLSSPSYALDAGAWPLNIELRHIQELVLEGYINADTNVVAVAKTIDGKEAYLINGDEYNAETGVKDQVASYGETWKVEEGTNPKDAKEMISDFVNSVQNVKNHRMYHRFYTLTSEAVVRSTGRINDKNGIGGEFIRPIEAGTFRRMDTYHGVNGNNEAGTYVRTELLKADGEKVDDLKMQLYDSPLYVDKTRTDIHGEISIVSYRNYMDFSVAAMEKYPVGDYIVRVHLWDEDPTDATYYYIDVPTSIQRAGVSKNLVMTPESAELGRGCTVTITATASGTTPSSYKWFANGEEIPGETGKSLRYTVPSDAEIGSEIKITARSYDGDTELAESSAVVRVLTSATGAAITAKGLTASEDGSFTIHHTAEDAGTWDFDASVTLDNGTVTDAVNYSLWGNQLRATSIDPATGVLTISPKETGVDGILHVLVSYTNLDGSSYETHAVIRLVANAEVKLEQAEGGRLTINVAAGAVDGGTKIVVRAVPDADKVVKEWLVNGESITGKPGYTLDTEKNTLTFNAEVATNYSITAVFEVGKVPVTWESQYVTVSAGGGVIASGEYIPYGTIFAIDVELPDGHDLENIQVTGATRNDNGTYTAGQSAISIEPVFVKQKHEHSYEAEVTAPTCTDMGYTTYTCTDVSCGHVYRDHYTDALGHDYEETVMEPTCFISGHTRIACRNCPFASITDITEPIPHAGVIVGAEEPTYIRDGYTGDTVCQLCNTVLELGRDIPHLVAERAEFTDVPQDSWHNDAVNYVVETGLMNGVGGGEFAPDAETTRAMMVTLLYRLEGEPDVSNMPNPFADIAEGSWYYNAVIWGVNTGVVKGVTATEFAPDQAVTREQMDTMMYRYAGEPDTDLSILDKYPDKADISDFAVAAMAWAVQEGIINGISKGDLIYLAPGESSTRSQIAAVFMRYTEG